MRAEELAGRFRSPETRRDGWWVFCPVHGDGQKAGRRSLRISDGKKGPLLKCWAGCENDAIIEAVGLTWAEILPEREPRRSPAENGGTVARRPAAQIVATYDYCDEAGALQFQVVRFEPKGFRQRRPDGDGWAWNLTGVRLVVYRLDELSLLRPPRVVVVEGEKHADLCWELGLPATTSAMGAGKWRADYAAQLKACGVVEALLTPDNDDPGRQHMREVGASLTAIGIKCRWLTLPGLPEKGDVVNWHLAGGTAAGLKALVDAAPAWPQTTSLGDVHDVFHKWLGDEYDAEVLDIVLATAAAERLDGDPCWLLVVSGSGAAKTETVQALEGADGHVVSMIASAGALLSGTSQRNQASDATGGLLRRIGEKGLLIIKDMTSILSMDRTTRAGVLAALREIHDGKWVREIGTDGGRVLTWQGRLALIGACTSAWDRAHEVVATMGDRFLIVRFDSTHGRAQAFKRARRNTGREIEMRKELATAVGALFNGLDTTAQLSLTDDEEDRLFKMADLLAFARTAVETDYREDVVTAHAPEMPTRVGKQLYQLIRGALAIGLSVADGMNLAARCARDTMPPLRLKILDDLTLNPQSTAADVSKRTTIPYMTARRTLAALHSMHLVTSEGGEQEGDRIWYTAIPSANTLVFNEYDVTTNVSGPSGNGASGHAHDVHATQETATTKVSKATEVPF